MKNTNKKGFTLVELVIVIAVIAILAAVLIPTFTSVINRANQSAALQKLKAEIDEAYVEFVADEHVVPGYFVKTTDGTYKFSKTASTTSGETNYEVTANKFVKISDSYDVYLAWDANKNYSVVTTATSGNVLPGTVV